MTLIEVLKTSRPYDEEGEETIVSRHAVDEAIATIAQQAEQIANQKALLEKQQDDSLFLVQQNQKRAEQLAAEKDASKWKQMAEFQYAIRQYPNNLDMGIGALDAYFKGWNYDAAIAAQKGKGK